MSFVPGTPNYATDESLTKLIQLIKNQFASSLNGTTILRLTKTEYDQIIVKDSATVYYVTDTDTGKVTCYLGDTKISGEGGGGAENLVGNAMLFGEGITGITVCGNAELIND